MLEWAVAESLCRGIMESTKKTKLYDIVIQEIRKMIAEKELKAGDKLPPERTIATTLAVSRNSVRQAISALTSKGVLISRQGDGTYLANPNIHNSDVVIELGKRLGEEMISPVEIAEARLYIECEIARLCALNANEEICKQLAEMVADYPKIGNEDKAALNRINRQFHLLVAKGCGNRVYYSLMETLMNLMDYGLWYKAENYRAPMPEYSRETHRNQHLMIADAILRHSSGMRGLPCMNT